MIRPTASSHRLPLGVFVGREMRFSSNGFLVCVGKSVRSKITQNLSGVELVRRKDGALKTHCVFMSLRSR